MHLCLARSEMGTNLSQGLFGYGFMSIACPPLTHSLSAFVDQSWVDVLLLVSGVLGCDLFDQTYIKLLISCCCGSVL